MKKASEVYLKLDFSKTETSFEMKGKVKEQDVLSNILLALTSKNIEFLEILGTHEI